MATRVVAQLAQGKLFIGFIFLQGSLHHSYTQQYSESM